jgi:2-phosphosulfolactate phosphatase
MFALMTTRVGVEWGLEGALHYASRVDVIVVVDVLSFSTSVAVAVERGAEVWPHPGGPSAQELADGIHGVLAGRRTLTDGPSLSPTSLLDLPPNSRLVLPSPNGGVIAHALIGQPCRVLVAALRNASAVGRYLAEARDVGSVMVVPAGERWEDGSMRVAYEDLVGAGGVIARMLAVDPAVQLTAEAEAAMAAYERLRPISDTPSGQELSERSFQDDIVLASAADASSVVPELRDDRFVGVGGVSGGGGVAGTG